MNRTHHLIQSAVSASLLTSHFEHIVVDYGSDAPVQREQLPSDPRIKLVRVEAPKGEWWLTHSYNLAFSLASGDYLLKLDADVILTREFEQDLIQGLGSGHADLICTRPGFSDWASTSELIGWSGLFVARRSALDSLGGFNPYIQGYGWDEIDLTGRFFRSGYLVAKLSTRGVSAIEHSSVDRIPKKSDTHRPTLFLPRRGLMERKAIRTMSATNLKNKEISTHFASSDFKWPTSEDYKATFNTRGLLPTIESVSLLSDSQRWLLEKSIASILLSNSVPIHLLFAFLRRLGLWLMPKSITRKILYRDFIDLDYISSSGPSEHNHHQ